MKYNLTPTEIPTGHQSWQSMPVKPALSRAKIRRSLKV